MGQKYNDIYDIIGNDTPLSQVVLILRLHDEYNNRSNDLTSEAITLLKLRIAYDNINKKVESGFQNDELLQDEEVKNSIYNKYLILKNYFNSFNINDRDMVLNTVNLITKLECLFKLPITFPVSIERCLDEEIKSIKREGDVNGRYIK